jgi:molecular chaperone DnaK
VLTLNTEKQQQGQNPSGIGSLAGQSTPSSTPSSSPISSNPNVPPDEQCTDAIKANPRWVCLLSATFDGTKITIDYTAEWAGSTPNVGGGFHLHIYGGTGTNPPDRVMGTHSKTPGSWYVEDRKPSVRTATSNDYRNAIGNQPKVCARIANSQHQLIEDVSGSHTYVTGNCIPITRS